MKLKILSLALVLLSANVWGQSESEQVSLTGSWTGSLVIGRDSFDMVFMINQDGDDYSASIISRQMGIYGMPAESAVMNNNRITIHLELIGAEYTGRIRLNESGDAVAYIDGEWFQEGEMVPVILRPAEK